MAENQPRKRDIVKGVFSKGVATFLSNQYAAMTVFYKTPEGVIYRVMIMCTLNPKTLISMSVQGKCDVQLKVLEPADNNVHTFDLSQHRLRDTVNWKTIFELIINSKCSNYSCVNENCLPCGVSMFIKLVCGFANIEDDMLTDVSKRVDILSGCDTEIIVTETLYLPPPR